jgi:surfeit locus 1 family protein
VRRLPLLPTLLVVATCLTMIGLGIWQLQRAAWKEALLKQYAAAQNLPPIAYPGVPTPRNLPLFRKSQVFCLSVEGWTPVAGRNAKGDSGWSLMASCRTGAEGPGVFVDAGWSKKFDTPDWKGGSVSGILAPDTKHVLRLVSDKPLAPSLVASAPPSLDDVPNNHLAYAVQWFVFVSIAAGIYVLALRRRKPTV